jgi:hypothetical protein
VSEEGADAYAHGWGCWWVVDRGLFYSRCHGPTYPNLESGNDSDLLAGCVSLTGG